jgi:hypothetical protein
MTQNPKEKAEELVYKYEYLVQTWDCYNDEPLGLESKLPQMKQCALVSVKEILKTYDSKDFLYPKEVNYWQEVQSEIENYND